MKKFIRGFADTDGSLMIKRNNYPKIKLCSKSEPLIEDISKWLKSQDLTFWHGCERQFDKRTGLVYQRFVIELSGKKNLLMWMNFIGFKNKRHYKKYKNGTGEALSLTFGALPL